MNQIFDKTIKDTLDSRIKEIEYHMDSDVVFHYGEIHPSIEKPFRNFIEQLKHDVEFDRDRLTIVLNTPGGSAETVEKMVNIIRYHYDEIFFIVPDSAMSAGTIFCMSGDKIYMDYSSSLGPIDPQIFNGKTWVPALGYLDKVEELIYKSSNNELTEAEFLILQKIDLAELRSYEMARDLTVSLLKEWLVKYKFKNWNTHKTDGKAVTKQDKKSRAENIAKKLGNNSLWQSHGRSININTLKATLGLEIEDYSEDCELQHKIRNYNDLITEYITRHGANYFAHSRLYF